MDELREKVCATEKYLGSTIYDKREWDNIGIGFPLFILILDIAIWTQWLNYKIYNVK